MEVEVVPEQPIDNQILKNPEMEQSSNVTAESEEVTPMDTSNCDITTENNVQNIPSNEEPSNNDNLVNGEEATEDVISVTSESQILSDKTKPLSQATDTSLNSVVLLSSQDSLGALKGEKSTEFVLHVSTESETEQLDPDANEVDPIETTLVAVAAQQEANEIDQEDAKTENVPSDDTAKTDITLSQANNMYERSLAEEAETSSKNSIITEDLTQNDEIKQEQVEDVPMPEQHELIDRDAKTPEPIESAPIEIVDLGDTDEDEEEDQYGSEAQEYEEGETDESYDEENDEIERKSFRSAKNEYEYYDEPENSRKKLPRHYMPSDLNRIYVQRMKRRSVKWLNYGLYSLKKRRMQIMDDSDAVECETKVPSGSPDIIKASKENQVDSEPKIREIPDEISENEQNDEKENTDPSLFSSEESKEHISESSGEMENGEIESKTGDEEDESMSNKNDDSIQLIDSDEDEMSQTDTIPEPKIEIKKETESNHDENNATVPKPIVNNNNNSKLECALLEDLGSDEMADVKRSPAPINEDNLYDDIENEVKVHVVDFSSSKPQPQSVDQTVEKIKNEAIDISKSQESEKKSENHSNKPDTVVIENNKKQEEQKRVDDEKSEENNKKRRRSASPIPNDINKETIQPSKKLRLELESSYGRHDKLLREYIESTNRSKNVEDVKRNIETLESEIKSLDVMLRQKEDEWNNILHMKMVKEEIRLRLQRKQAVLEMKLTNPYSVENSTASGIVSSTPIQTKPNQHNACNAPLLQESLKTGRNLPAPVQNLSQTVTMLPLSTSMNSSTQSILQQRANMKGNDLVKEKQTAAKIQRNILPRPTTLPNHEQILRNLAMSSATSSAFQQQQLNDLFNGHSKANNMGRQGPTKDVQSIIADFREKNPDVPPRRGRRVKGSSIEMNSRPSSADSSHSNSNAPLMNNASFKDILAQFAKMTPAERQLYGSNNSIISALNMTTQNLQGGTSGSGSSKPPPYPEVTLHPVMNALGGSATNNTSNLDNTNTSSSLLHGILTKTQNRSGTNNQATAATAANFQNYSPTLARLLTSPERISSQSLPNYTQASNNTLGGITSGLNLSAKNSEITITPVVNSQTLQQTLLAQQQRQKDQFMNIDDDNDDNSTDRLVIDEGDNQNSTQNAARTGEDFQDSEVPECQGCRRREAQFVCAGCGNQWYCSRECQVAAWDEHSENCQG
uniref:CSON004742 protein n=1 Tax=Culicoides sonorensis TaxID=179676 RepID=A0A336LTY5_CULSO